MLIVKKVKERNKNVIKITIFPGVSKESNQSSVFDANRRFLNLVSTNYAGNSVYLVTGIIRLPSSWEFSVCIGHK